MSLPRESAGLGFAGSAGSTLSSLSELTEMMTRLTSTSDESEDKFPRVGAPGGQPRADHAPEGTSKVGLCLSVGQTPLTSLERDLILRGSSRDRVYVPSSVGTLDIARSTSRDTSAKISGPQEPSVKVPGSRWTKGSDGKQWFMLSRSSTLSSVGGVLGKDSIPPAGEGEDNVFPDAREDKSPVSGSEESGSIASLPSGTLSSDKAKRVDESSTTSEAHELAPSTLSSVSNGSRGGSSQTSDFHGNLSEESNTGNT